MKPCLNCAKGITRHPKYSDTQWESRKYCSLWCRPSTTVNLTCLTCKKMFQVKNYRRNKAKHCSVKCRTLDLTSDGQGYLRIGGSKKRQHRVVVEQHLGRELDKNEHVHHINHNKSDNRIENLIVVTASWHMKIHWAIRKGLISEA